MTGPRLRVVAVSQYNRRRVETLTPTLQIPLGAVTVVVGWQGIGKGTLAARIASDENRLGHAVGFVSDEDSFSAVIRPRLEAAGADLDRVFTFLPVAPDDAGVLVPRDNAEIEQAAEELGMRVVFLDPWTNHIDVPDIDKGSVRRALMPFAAMCRRGGLASILTAHPNRRDTDDPLTSIAHASAVSQVARCVYHVTIDPTSGSLNPKVNPDRLLIHGKTNMTRYGDTLRFKLEPTLLRADDSQPEVDTVRAEYTGVSETIPDYATVRQLIRRLERDPKTGSDADEAADWLRDYLADRPRPIAHALADGAAAGAWSERTIQRAAKKLKVKTTRPPGSPASVPASWSLESVSPKRTRGKTGETGETGQSRGEPTVGDSLFSATGLPVSPVSPHYSAGQTALPFDPTEDPDEHERRVAELAQTKVDQP